MHKSGTSDLLSGLDWPVRVNKGASSGSPLGIRTDFCVQFVWFQDDRSLKWAEGASSCSISHKTLKRVPLGGINRRLRKQELW